MKPEIASMALDAFKRKIYAKNIDWIYGPKIDLEEFDAVKAMAGSAGMCAWMIHKAHYRIGVQMQISQGVSDDLQASDFASTARLENVPWIAPCVEFYFEDPLLPCIIMLHATPDDNLQALFTGIEMRMNASDYITCLMQEGHSLSKSMQLNLQLKPDMYEAFMQEAATPCMELTAFSSNLSQTDHCVMCYMMHLALKVMVFASIPQYKATPIHRKQMHWGGKPGFKGRPVRPAYKVEYLPKVIRVPSPAAHDAEGRDFKGRRGHIRWYSDERYVNRKGTWDWIFPVVDPHTGKYPERHVIKVRKP